MQAKNIKDRLKSLIKEASAIDPSLEKRLNQIYRWVKDVKPGSLTANKFVLFFLQQITRDSRTWLDIKSLASEEEQQKYYERMTPTERYWYSYLFPQWLKEDDPIFFKWKQKLMAGEFNQADTDILKAIATDIIRREGTFWQCYITDLSMATDIIVSGRQNKPLCVQITSLSDEYSQSKSDTWENTLVYWGIERGLFLSYNPGASNFVNQIVTVSLDNSNNLRIGIYLKFSL
ncbi:hypothetical protein [Cylindrospermum sp. FACHB-282]|uniref:hypothetical protein n=1 Tax=Cylindrospermum sp. FACHB-282 TaxID=2692794 RepID=UPI001688590F|nr:hypothetical protein [Cylindrospermum sp. FACHB-282]MBD2387959.1 hypothetical protein [Cylindrospermum sp. FACHB-282]